MIECEHGQLTYTILVIEKQHYRTDGIVDHEFLAKVVADHLILGCDSTILITHHSQRKGEMIKETYHVSDLLDKFNQE